MPTLDRLTTEALRDTVRTFRDAVRAHAVALNRLNVYPVPDGDTGTNMARTLDAVVDEMDDATDVDDLVAVVRRDQPWVADGGAGQQRRDPESDPARVRDDRQAARRVGRWERRRQRSPLRCEAASRPVPTRPC